MGRPAARPDDETAQRYLAKGWQLIQSKLGYGSTTSDRSTRTRAAKSDDVPEFPLLGVIGPTDVIDDAETTGGFYRRWTSKAQYLADLVRYILDNSRMVHGTPEQRSRGLLMRLKDRPSFSEFVQAAAREEMNSLKEDPAFAVQLHMWAASRTHEWVRELMASGYAEATEQWSEAYELVLKFYGMRLRPGFDERRLAVVLTAILDGLTLRRGLEPDAVDDELFPEAVLALLLGLLEREDSDEQATLIEAFDNLAGTNPETRFAAAGASQRR
jgi:hypothetical protein